jgi:DNA modification methylase
MQDYIEFLKSKEFTVQDVGFDVPLSAIHPTLFHYQRDITKWAIKRGRVALFEDVGLGKTCQLGEFARQIDLPTLIISPLAVAHQTIDELHKLIDMDVRYVRSSKDLRFDECKFYITNYEMVDKFNADDFEVVILDESSILKNLTGKMRNALIEQFKDTPYRLCATATPAPNDIEEIGNHAEFLGVMKHSQMLSTFFVHDSQLRNGAWRLKKHAVNAFYRWLASWSIALEKPSDLGYSDDGFIKPCVNYETITIDTAFRQDGKLAGFEDLQISATDAKRIRRESIEQRANLLVEFVNQTNEQYIIWCGLNKESELLDSLLPDAVNVTGSMKPDDKIDAIRKFVNGDIRILISKTKIAGMGVNMQNCKNMVWFGIDYSWEQFYQGIGRICRYGQQSDVVDVTIITSEHELGIVETIFEKDRKASEMRTKLIQHMALNSEVKNDMTLDDSAFVYATDETETDDYKMWLGDSVERMRDIPDNSIHLSVYSPPFNDVFVYSNTNRDIGNSKDYDEFMEHYRYIIRENLRVTMPGRRACVHVSELRTLATRDGYRGLVDFSGRVIEEYVNAGWIWRGRVTIDKNPQALAIRTKDTDLLFATLKRDSASSVPMNTDYLLLFDKPGDNPIPVTPVLNGEVSQEDWIQYARAVWYDISETDVLNVRVGKANEDEKHMCPLQLPLIDRCVRLWSNPDETVFSPFGGIGSEGYQAILRGRKYHGIELKPEYYSVAVRNLAEATTKNKQIDMFSLLQAN